MGFAVPRQDARWRSLRKNREPMQPPSLIQIIGDDIAIRWVDGAESFIARTP